MPAREKTSVTFLAAAVEPRGTMHSAGEAEIAGLADGRSAGPRYRLLRGELNCRSSRSVAPIILRKQRAYKVKWYSNGDAQPTLLDRLGHQFDVLLACRFAFGVLPDPGFPTTSVRHVAARKGKPGDIGAADGNLPAGLGRSEEDTSELQSPCNLVCRLLREKKKQNAID